MIKNCIEYKVNEECIALLLMIENVYISKMIIVPKHIYKEIEKLYDMLVYYIERDYKNVSAKKVELIRKIFIDENK